MKSVGMMKSAWAYVNESLRGRGKHAVCKATIRLSLVSCQTFACKMYPNSPQLAMHPHPLRKQIDYFLSLICTTRTLLPGHHLWFEVTLEVRL